jgi:hypothetical protein
VTDATEVQLLGLQSPTGTFGGGGVQSFALLGGNAFVATRGDGLWTFLQPPFAGARTYNPGPTDGPLETASYRSLYVSPTVIAWTGRQGVALEYMDPSKCLSADAVADCPVTQISDPAPSSGVDTAESGFGVTAVGKKLRWLTPSGIWSLPLNTTDATFVPRANTTPGSLVHVETGLLFSQGHELRAVEFDASYGGPAETLALDAGGEIRDLVALGHFVYILAANANVVTPTLTAHVLFPLASNDAKQIRAFLVSVPAQQDPRSLAVGPDGVYLSTNAGVVYRFGKL